MTTSGDEEQLAISIIAKLGDLEKQMAKANGITAKAFREMSLSSRRATREMETEAAKSAERINAAMATVGTKIGAVGQTIAAATAAAFSTEKLVEASQAYVRASNSLKVAGLSGAALTDTFDRLYRIAQANGAPIETLVGLYSKAAQVQTALGASSNQLIQFTTAVAEALRVSGTSAETAQGALLQMGQALGTGTVHAEEWNSMLEGMYPILQAAAAGIKEAGGEVSKLTTLVKDGQVSSKAFFYGVLAGAPTLTDKLAGSTETLSQAWTKFENALVKSVGELDAVTGATGGLASGLESLIPWVEKLPTAVNFASESWGRFKNSVNEAAAAFNRFMGYDQKDVMKAAGLTSIEEARNAAASEALRKGLQKPYTTGGGFGTDDKQANKRIADAFSLFDKVKDPIKTVSLKDFPAEGKKKGGGAETEDEYERAIRKTQEHTAALGVEITTVGQSTEAKTKAAKAQELLTAAKQADKQITPALLAEIDKEASAYAASASRLEKAKEAHQELIDIQRFAGQSLAGFFSDIVSGGKNAEEAFMNLTKKMADALMQAALLGEGPLASLLGAKSSTGGVGGLFGSLFNLFSAKGSVFSAGRVQAFAKGGSFTNSVVDKPTMFGFAGGAGLMGEAGPEAIMPLARDKSGRLGVAMQGQGGASPVSITIGGTSITITGDANRQEIASLKAELAARDRALPAAIRAAVNDGMARGRIAR